MALETFLLEQPQPKKSLLKRIFNRGLISPEPRKPIKLEFFNADRTKRFAFREIQSAPGKTYELDVSLSYVTNNKGLVEKMQVMTRIEDGIQYYGIEIYAISEVDNKLQIYYYNRETGGQKLFSGMTGRQTPDETKFMIEKLGIIKESDLPEFIDYEKTAIEFLNQAKRLDFDTEPNLYPKELIASEPPKALLATP